MASIILSTVGNMILPGIGGIVGSYVGSAIDRAIFSPKIKSYGPRLSDLTVQTSTEGATLPILFGTMRFAGNVIWSTGLTENATTEEQGGMSGGGNSYTTYSYTTDAAVAICEGVITGVRRIWADSKLIYDVSETASLDTLLSSSSLAKSIRIYTGTEDQLEDPLIQAVEGVAPAYRGTAYIVIEDLNLADFGNRLPNFTFEVVKLGTPNNMSTMAEYIGAVRSNYDLHVVRYVDDDGVYSWRLVQSTAYLMTATQYFTPHGSTIAPTPTGISFTTAMYWWALQENRMFSVKTDEKDGLFYSQGIYGTSFATLYRDTDGATYALGRPASEYISRVSSAVKAGSDIYYAVSYSDSTGLPEIRVSAMEEMHPTMGATSIYTVIPLPYNLYVYSSINLAVDTNYIYASVTPASAINTRRCLKFDRTTLNYISDLLIPGTETGQALGFVVAVRNDGMLLTANTSGEVYTSQNFSAWQSVGTLALKYRGNALDGHMWANGNVLFNFAEYPDSGGQVWGWSTLNTLTKSTTPLQTICNILLTSSGLVSNQYDFSNLATINVNGYLISRVSTIRSTLEPLMSSYSFELLEEDNKLVAKKLSSNSIQQALVKDNLGSEQI